MLGCRPVATSNISPVTLVPSLRTTTTPPPSSRTSVTVALRWTSQRATAWTVKRCEISASRLSIKVAAFSTTWISTPRLEKTWAISAATAASAENHHAGGQRVQPHDRVRGVEFDPRVGHHRRDRRPAAGGDHHLFRLDTGIAVDHQLMRTGEARLTVEEDDVRGLGPPPAPRRRGLIDPSDDSIPDGRPIDRLERRREAELPRPADLEGEVRRVGEHLGRDAASVDTGPPE